MKRSSLCLSLFIPLLLVLTSCANNHAQPVYAGYLFSYFSGNGEGEEQVHFALSADGFNFRALNHNQAVLDSAVISRSGGVRDPHLLRGEDGRFYMVLTDLHVPTMGWQNTAMVMLTSKDLIHWHHSVVDIPETFPQQFGDVNRVWAPQTIYDEQAKRYMVYFSMRQDNDSDIIYYAYANDDFSGLISAPKQLYFPPKWAQSKASIDGDIVKKDGKFYLFHKSEDGQPGIKLAVSHQLTKGYQLLSSDRVDRETNPVEGSGTFKLIDRDEYMLMYDVYTRGQYQFTTSRDLKHFSVVDNDVSMNFHPRHGSVIPVTQAEIDALVNKWGSFDGAIASSTSPLVNKMNIVVDDAARTVYLPLKDSADLAAFDPKFLMSPGAKIAPLGPQNFSLGAVTYQVSVNGQQREYKVTAAVVHNPIIGGYYADPEVIYSHKLQKYFLYPTSDGFTGWSGSYFETFSSNDLVHWHNEGKILQLSKDVSWADSRAWAPTAVEVKQAQGYRYYYYFSAGQKIGVASSDNPQGPFVDSGKPLIDQLPQGVAGGQQIDPDVFTDPVSGKHYLYWGNGYMAVAELSDDMLSLKPGTTKLLTPDATYREGTEVFYRNGTYYFMWSENDTRDPSYRVRYATAKSPLGPLTVPQNNLVIEQDATQGIFATGHNAVIQQPGTNNWFIVYHRFSRPHGITMGKAAGYHREVCIDALRFNADGSVQEVKPSLTGIAPAIPVHLNK
ncbi:family 43 glycosylhydrolase [Shewanella sp. Isolate11]|uniref:family 43 glycosylhydrolase n=1 Tax=Shewanella sp. Isolate11 TaxID=2908530 RepID=UPI001EFE54A6|nr:family 43 glycosylhydrolase [Shewanella sp. Isolate11]MCG9697926.1 family 43 glycosylhydrolase [Shewanella sp. Isolate11]